MGIVESLIVFGEYISDYCELDFYLKFEEKNIMEDNICNKCYITYPKLFMHCCHCQMSWQFIDKHCCYCKKTFFLSKKKNHICEKYMI